MPAAMRRRSLLALVAVLAVGSLAACGERGVDVPTTDASVHRGAVLFAERCSGCHTLDVAGTEGGALKVGDRERTDGPNFNVRKETKDSVLYAIRNGGFSGAIMPENIVVGQQAEDIAAFLAKYAGAEAK